ncbi:hypothetical protein BJY18_001211 [Amycolatopsis jiangsuensis]|uniref:Uncharacterized protein n=1 Tax=Amycolatopsis jiangsuensis TaxID=1181879 RepID=A0A840IN00_9PSEU|nr:hypothetical protein [Amycolatopsis jiangsuensis]
MSTLVLYTPETGRLDLARLGERDFVLSSSLQYKINRSYRVLPCQRLMVEDESCRIPFACNV